MSSELWRNALSLESLIFFFFFLPYVICDGVCPSTNKRFTYLLTYILITSWKMVSVASCCGSSRRYNAELRPSHITATQNDTICCRLVVDFLVDLPLTCPRRRITNPLLPRFYKLDTASRALVNYSDTNLSRGSRRDVNWLEALADPCATPRLFELVGWPNVGIRTVRIPLLDSRQKSRR